MVEPYCPKVLNSCFTLQMMYVSVLALFYHRSFDSVAENGRLLCLNDNNIAVTFFSFIIQLINKI